MPAKLPEELIRQPERHLRDLKVGEMVYINHSHLKVAADGSCYLKPDAPFSVRCSYTMEVRREEDGYHVVVITKDSWKPGAVITDRDIPVQSILVNLDPELDTDALMAEIQKNARELKERTQRYNEDDPNS